MMEKRGHRRFALRFPVRLRETFALPPLYRSVQARDLSMGGVRFLSDAFLPVDTSLILELILDGKSRPVRAISRVAWSRSERSGHRYEIGSSFVEITPTEKQSLRLFLEGQPVRD